MPAAAVIPAPAAYIKFAAVKKLVVGFLAGAGGPPRGEHCPCVGPHGPGTLSGQLFGRSCGALN